MSMNKSDLDLFIQTVMSIAPMGQNTQNNQFRICADDAVALCREVQPIFEKEKTVLDLVSPINICGDIHGQLADLVRCLQIGGFPPSSRWLFLGDFVDRGPCSVEVITLLFALKIRYPYHIYLIRGNHESLEMTEVFGFMRECIQKFDLFPQKNRAESHGELIWMEFCSVFEYIPVAAIVANDYLCIHGGISPYLEKVQQIRDLKRPLRIPLSGLVTDLFWSDPSKQVKDYGESGRGSTCVWGLAPIKKFLRENKLKCLIRGHQFVAAGYDYPFHPEKYVITMFTASNYTENIANTAAFLVMDKDGKYEIQTLPPLVSHSSPQLVSPSELVSPSPKDAPIVSNLTNNEQNVNTPPPRRQIKVRSMANHSFGPHRRSLPIDKDHRQIVANQVASMSGNQKAPPLINEDVINPEENDNQSKLEDKISTPPQNNIVKESKSQAKKCSLSINSNNIPNLRRSKTVASPTKASNQNQSTSSGKTPNQNQANNSSKGSNQVASPSNVSNSRLINANTNIKTVGKRISNSNDNFNVAVASPPVQVKNNPNIPNHNIPTNFGLDLSSLDSNSGDNTNELEEVNNLNAPASPPNMSKIRNIPSIPLVMMDQNKTKKNESSFPKPPPVPSSARVAKANPYHMAANARMVNEISPLIKSVEKRKKEYSSDDSILNSTAKPISKSSVNMTPPRSQKNSQKTPPKSKNIAAEYAPTPRPNITKTPRTRARSNSLKMSPI